MADAYSAPFRQLPAQTTLRNRLSPSTSHLPPLPETALWKVGFAIVLIDVVFTYSRLPEMIALRVGTSLYIPTMIRLLGFCFALFAGGVFTALSSVTGRALVAFTVWMVICTPFSVWKGGSVDLLLHFWFPAMTGFFAVNGIIAGTAQVRRFVYMISLSSIFIVLLSRSVMTVNADRAAFDLGTLANSNDLAALVLLGLPGLILLFQLNSGRKHLMYKLVAVLCVPIMLSIVFQTASRGALLNVLIICVIGLFTAKAQAKLIIVGLGFLLVIGLAVFAPPAALERYKTLLPGTDSAVEFSSMTSMSAAYSSRSREHLFWESVDSTLRHPIFGVGPGAFIAAEAAEDEAQGKRPMWLGSHNGFTQVASETGIPGLLMYLTAFASCFGAVLSISKATKKNPELQHLRSIAIALLMSLSCMSLNFMLGSIAYLPFFPILAAIVDGFRRSAKTEIETWKKSRPTANHSHVVPIRRFIQQPAQVL